MFKYEREMTAPVISWMKLEGLSVKREFVTSWGICDLVGVRFNKKNVEKRKKQRQFATIGTPSRIKLLNHIPHSDKGISVTFKKLARIISDHYLPEEVEVELNRLKRNRFIDSPKRNHYQSINGWTPLQERIVAIELKLNRIEEAFHQAYNNLAFASESYTAFPIDTAQRLANSKRVDRFYETGIGVIGVNKSNCSVIIPAKINNENYDLIFQTHCVERFWNIIIKDNST